MSFILSSPAAMGAIKVVLRIRMSAVPAETVMPNSTEAETLVQFDRPEVKQE